MSTITELLELFGVVTVMDVHVYKIKDDYKYGIQTLNKNVFQDTELCLDTLKISNIKQNTPKKQFNIGLFNIPLVKTGKTISIEMQDALGHKKVLEYFFGGKFYNTLNQGEMYSFDTSFGSLLCLEGKTWIVDLNGNKQVLWITIPCFMPKGALNLNLQADGEAGVFDLSGDVYPVVWNEGEGLQYIMISTTPLVGVWNEVEEEQVIPDESLDN